MSFKSNLEGGRYIGEILLCILAAELVHLGIVAYWMFR